MPTFVGMIPECGPGFELRRLNRADLEPLGAWLGAFPRDGDGSHA